MVINFFLLLVGLYCLLESVAVAGEMHKGDRLCRVGKYLLSGVTGFYVICEALAGHGTWQLLMLQTAVALGVWPRMVYRIVGNRRTEHHVQHSHQRAGD
jgi:hypothetical protein